MAFCTNCGTQSQVGNRFCVACGTPLGAAAGAARVTAAAATRAAGRALSQDTLKLLTNLVGALALVGGLLAAAALLLPSSAPNRLWFFWSWRAEFLRWELVGSVAPLVIAGVIALTLGRGNSRWVLGCTAAGALAITRMLALWARFRSYDGYFHLPSIKSLALLVGLAASAASAGLAVAVVVRRDPPLLRLDSSLIRRALVVGVALTVSNVVALQWISPPDNFFTVYTAGFHAGVPVAVSVTLLLIALLYGALLVGAAACGSQAAGAVGLVIAGAWTAFVAEGLTGLGMVDGERVSAGIGFVLALGGMAALAWFVIVAIRDARSLDPASPNDDTFPFVASIRAVIVTVTLYLLLLMPLHVVTTGYAASGYLCATPFDAAWDKTYQTRDVGGKVDPITNEWIDGRTIREGVRGPCQDAAPGRLLIAGVGLVVIGAGAAGAWVAAPAAVRKLVGRRRASTPLTS